MSAQTAGPARPGRCLGCQGRIKVAEAGTVTCPLCGLALLNLPRLRVLPPIVVPRAGRDDCWNALVRELRLPVEDGAAQVRRARMLLVPFWRHVDESKRSATRPSRLQSAADLTPVGLPRLTEDRQRISGLEVEPRTRTGDAMGRIEAGATPPDADVVDVTLGPDPSDRPASELFERELPPGTPWWQLVYYPIWSFHYIVYSKEYFSAVDATCARPIGPAHRIRWGLVALAGVAPMLAIVLALAPLVGALAAIPAWLAGIAAMRLTLRSQRGA